ncbi:hypothetical protein QOZ80_6BG0474300 [Eleusine coracana subsp. coracana]|nr:hypothetical protein QOZ80_6BG0474300 [Eleusine coracana subsp. coracana]
MLVSPLSENYLLVQYHYTDILAQLEYIVPYDIHLDLNQSYNRHGIRRGRKSNKKPRQSASPGALTALTLRLAKKFAASTDEGNNKNVIFSPLSIYSALSLIAAGAGGDTLDELLSNLGVASREDLAEFVGGVAERVLADGSASGRPHVSFACGVFHDKTRTLKPAYREAAVESYRAEAHAVDSVGQPSAAVKEINVWAAHTTKGLITNVLSPSSLNPDTRLVVANAIYFKGSWENTFYEGRTRMDNEFYRLDGTAVDVPLMCKDGGRHQLIAEHDGFKVLVLPYRVAPWSGIKTKIPRFRMCFFLPDERDRDSSGPVTRTPSSRRTPPSPTPGSLVLLVDEHHPRCRQPEIPYGVWVAGGLLSSQDMEEVAASGTKDFLDYYLPTNKVDVGKLRLPRFKTTFQNKLTRVLKEMGVGAAFDPDRADLSDMAEDDGSGMPLVVQDVFYKAVIEVNEQGTRAAAVTNGGAFIGCSRPGTPTRPVDFVADHPFLFFIVEQHSMAVVFAG